jgi:exopolysaccharide biosynthesis polyprenyl glycosylphosphotransferase
VTSVDSTVQSSIVLATDHGRPEEPPGSAFVARREWQACYVRRVLAVDLVAAALAATAALLLRFGITLGALGQRYALLSALVPLVWIGVLGLGRAYEPRLMFIGTDEYERTLRAGVALTAGASVLSYALDADLARGYLLAVVLLCTPLSLVGRFVLRKRLHRARRRGEYTRRTVVLGPARAAVELTRQLHRQYHHGLTVVGICVPADEPGAEIDPAGPPVYRSLQVASQVVALGQADTVIALPCQELDGVRLRRLAWQLEQDHVDLIVSSSLLDVTGDRITIRPIDGLPMLHIEHPRLAGGRRIVKSLFDVAGALLLLTLLAPVFLAVSLLIAWDSPGPALFRQVRVGLRGKRFNILKFRTMYADAEARLAGLRDRNDGDGVLFKMRDDPRVTPVGRWLRRFSLDELPQLINVLLGQMSLVGPRPPLPAEVELYPDDMRRRLVVKPGLTGLWQVSGRADLPWQEAVRLDLRYVENWSLSLDLVILLRTVVAVWRASGAY